jgi:hypothetical protein
MLSTIIFFVVVMSGLLLYAKRQSRYSKNWIKKS